MNRSFRGQICDKAWFYPGAAENCFFGGKNAGLRFYYSINGGKQTQDEKTNRKGLISL
ncbi:hypothetical protein CLOLEP_01483 [[Clostridium] leptum DSM 753]|jgi:hypothetical protein|uniref:Uncharacterized protein n=1 Tax=[Clostridium] leptum DSM 753 TaxID=428125 RepID=A7VSE4_9FIRM|nr:hypothetical protein CLOLEP_01483 [[Clostridium] leptum DSM 753]